MALVTIQRAPSNLVDESLDQGVPEVPDSIDSNPKRRMKKLYNTVKFINRLRFSESYFAYKGAALILPKQDISRVRKRRKSRASSEHSKRCIAGDIEGHLQSMFLMIRPQDTIRVAIKLETATNTERYLAIVETPGVSQSPEGIVLGLNCSTESAVIGLVIPIWQTSQIQLNGDGGFRFISDERPHIFKPISVQAMWSALSSLTAACDKASEYRYAPGGLSHQWVSWYQDKRTPDESLISEWEMLDDLMVTRAETMNITIIDESQTIERLIRSNLREVIIGRDLEEVTSYELRLILEERMGMSLKKQRSFVDQEVLLLLRQLDSASEILDFIYLGSEWNAGNLPELQSNGIGYILNATREIDNFFPGSFKYMNIRVYDEEDVDLMRYWEATHKFIAVAKENNSKVLVHCKMGVSRSASTVIAYIMKEFSQSLDEVIEFVRSKRPVIKPNDAFMHQLRTYEGILNASKQRWNPKFVSENSREERSLKTDSTSSCDTNISDASPCTEETWSLQGQLSKENPARDTDSECDTVSSDLTTSTQASSHSACSSTTTELDILGESSEATTQPEVVSSNLINLRPLENVLCDSQPPSNDNHIPDLCTPLPVRIHSFSSDPFAQPLSSCDSIDRTQSEAQLSTTHKSDSTKLKGFYALDNKDVESSSNRSEVLLTKLTIPLPQTMPNTNAHNDSVLILSNLAETGHSANPRETTPPEVSPGCVKNKIAQLAEISQESTTRKVDSPEETVTPGIVKQLLTEIERISSLPIPQLGRSSSLRDKTRQSSESSTGNLQRSRSVRERHAEHQSRTGSDHLKTFLKLQHERKLATRSAESSPDKSRQEMEGLSQASSATSEPEPSRALFKLGADETESAPSEDEIDQGARPKQYSINAVSPHDGLLKIPSSFGMMPSGSDRSLCSQLSFQALTDEPIYEPRVVPSSMCEPLSVRVASYNSDPFAHPLNQKTYCPTHLERSTSLSEFPSHTCPMVGEPILSSQASKCPQFEIRNNASLAPTNPALQPYWKLKRDNTYHPHPVSKSDDDGLVS